MKRVLLTTLVVAVVISSACGVPDDSTARLVPTDRIPDALESSSPETSIPTQSNDPVDLWFVRDGRMVKVRHSIAVAADPTAIINELLAGPTDIERSTNLRSAIPDPEAVAAVEVRGGIATVRLTSTFSDIPAADQLLAIAQFVLTLTDLRGIGRVGFTIGDTPVPVPVPDGGTATATVSRDEFLGLI